MPILNRAVPTVRTAKARENNVINKASGARFNKESPYRIVVRIAGTNATVRAAAAAAAAAAIASGGGY